MVWLATAGVVAVAAAWLFVPGVLFGLGAGVRGLALWAFAPVASTAVLATGAIILALVDVPWSIWSAAAVAGVAALAAWGVRSALRLPAGRPSASGPRWLVVAGLGAGAALATLRLALYIGEPDNVSQTNDAVFHLNALRYIIETGSASSLDLSGMLGATSFYPAAWHAPASLVALATGVDLPVVANAMGIAIGALVWTAGIAWLAHAATGGDRLAAGLAGALSAALAAFPLLMIQWGVLYPSLLAIALLPASLAPVVLLPRWLASPAPRGRVALGAALLIGTALVALALSQTSLLLIWGLLAGCFGLGRTVAAWPTASRRGRSAMAAATAAGALALAFVWFLLGRIVTGGVWPPSRGRLQAVLDVVANAQVGFPPAWAVSILTAIGLFVAVRRPGLRWLATAWAACAALYFIAVAVGNPALRGIVGPFYNDPYRIAAIMPVAVVPLAAIGAAWAARRVAHAIRSHRAAGVSAPPEAADFAVSSGAAATGAWAIGIVTVLGAVSLAIAPVIQWTDVFTGIVDRVTWYDPSNDDYLTDDERALLSRLQDDVPADQLIVGNPSTGMAFGYALGDHPVYPLTWQPPSTQAYDVLASSLNQVATDPLVCPAVEAIGADYVFDFGPGSTDYGRYILPGFTDLDGHDGFELVDREGAASLWRITACD